jgi:VanZ family protein
LVSACAGVSHQHILHTCQSVFIAYVKSLLYMSNVCTCRTRDVYTSFTPTCRRTHFAPAASHRSTHWAKTCVVALTNPSLLCLCIHSLFFFNHRPPRRYATHTFFLTLIFFSYAPLCATHKHTTSCYTYTNAYTHAWQSGGRYVWRCCLLCCLYSASCRWCWGCVALLMFSLLAMGGAYEAKKGGEEERLRDREEICMSLNTHTHTHTHTHAHTHTHTHTSYTHARTHTHTSKGLTGGQTRRFFFPCLLWYTPQMVVSFWCVSVSLVGVNKSLRCGCLSGFPNICSNNRCRFWW